MTLTALFVMFLCYSVVHRMEGSVRFTVTDVPSGGFLAKNRDSVEARATGSHNTHKVTPGGALTGTPVRLRMDQRNGWLHGERDILYFVDGFRADHGMGKQGRHRGVNGREKYPYYQIMEHVNVLQHDKSH